MQRLLALLLGFGTLAAGCSAPSTAPPAPAPLPIAQVRERVQAGIVAATGIQGAVLLAAVTASLEPPVVTRIARCRDGVEKTVLPTPDGVLETLDVYYEPSCTHRFVHATLNTLQFVADRLVIAATFETRSIDGRPIGYGKSLSTTTFSAGGSSTTMTGALSATPKGAPIELFGLACRLKSRGACGLGAVANATPLNASFGFTATFDGFAGRLGGSGTIAVQSYAGGLHALRLAPGSGIRWIVKGGAALGTQTGSYRQSGVSKAFASSGSTSLRDAANVNVDLNDDARTGITGSVTRDASIATFSTDATGAGRVAYASGSADRIDAFVIL